MKIFKLFLITAVLALSTNAALAGDTNRTQTLENVRSLSFIGEIDVTLVQGDDEKLVLSGHADALKKAELSVKKGKLTLESDSGFWGFFKSAEQTRISATVTIRQLEQLHLTGVIVLNAETLTGKALEFKSTGANHTSINELKVERLSLSQTGAGQLGIGQFSGEQLKVDFSGASKLMTESLKAKAQSFTLSGASQVNVDDLNGEQLAADLSGASSITISEGGEIQSQTIKLSGSSGYRAKALQSASVQVNASGASTIDLWVTTELDAKLTGSSNVRYRGNPTLSVKTSGASQVSSLDK